MPALDQEMEHSLGRRSLLAARLERWIETELKQIVEALRCADPVITCGKSDPDPRTEARISEARQALCAPRDDAGCGRPIVVWDAYRCVNCGRWFHRACIINHFKRHRPTDG